MAQYASILTTNLPHSHMLSITQSKFTTKLIIWKFLII